VTAEPPPRNTAPLVLKVEGDARTMIGDDWTPAPLAPPRPRRPPRSSLGWLAGGLVVLLASWAALAAVTFIDDLFARSTVLGALALAGFGAGVAMLGAAAVTESRAWRGLARVDRLRATLAGGSLPEMRAAAGNWVEGLRAGPGDPAPILAAIAAADSPAALQALLRAQVSAPLAVAAGRIGRQAALEGAALVAILPHPALDGLFAGLRGVRVIRQVAALYGLRPGTLAGFALARRVAWTAASTAGIDLVAQGTLDQALKSLPVVRHVAEAVPGMSAAAYRLYRLAQVTGTACDPLTRRTSG
jgi:uncharacterized membrane protein YcjF (UPF0283 family)